MLDICECMFRTTTIGLYKKCQRSQKFTSRSKALWKQRHSIAFCGLPSSLELFGLSWTVNTSNLLDKNHIVLQSSTAEPTDARRTTDMLVRLMQHNFLAACFAPPQKKTLFTLNSCVFLADKVI